MELKPCPFCGSDMDSFAGMTEAAFAKGSDGTFSIDCDCDAIGPSAPSMTEAIAAWNKRHKADDCAGMPERGRNPAL